MTRESFTSADNHIIISSSSISNGKMDSTIDSDWLNTEALDLLSSLEKADLVEPQQLNLAEADDVTDLDASYLEAFTDLSEYLLGDSNPAAGIEGADVLWDTPEVIHVIAPTAETREILPPTSITMLPSSSTSSLASTSTSTSTSTASLESSSTEGVKAAKRTAAAAFGSVEHVPANSDHDDYVLKRRRMKMETEVADSTTPIKTLSKADKYVERRKKNNVASKRSRETRKQKFTEMELQAQQLEKRNEELRAKIEMLEKMAKEMKATLVQKLALGK